MAEQKPGSGEKEEAGPQGSCRAGQTKPAELCGPVPSGQSPARCTEKARESHGLRLLLATDHPFSHTLIF